MTANRHSRRDFLRQAVATGAGVGALSTGLTPFMAMPVWAKDEPPIGTWPAGSQGSSVGIGAAVPRTGTYAVQGEDELKGYMLAVEHINAGHPLIREISRMRG